MKQTYEVFDTFYDLLELPDGGSMMLVRYVIHISRYEGRVVGRHSIYEYLNFEGNDEEKHRAAIWWLERSYDPVPQTNRHAVDSANYNALATVKEITVDTAYTLGEIPPNYNDERVG